MTQKVNSIYDSLWRSKKRYILCFGGRGGGRSFTSSQHVLSFLAQTEAPYRAALMRLIHGDIRNSNWQELKDRVQESETENAFEIADGVMTMKRGRNSINAVGFHKSLSERTAKLKSLANYTHAYIEEAEEVGKEDFRQLDDSLRAAGSKIVMCFNTPPVSHWIISEWFDAKKTDYKGFYELSLKQSRVDDTEIIFSDHEKNFYLTEETHKRYEAYKQSDLPYYLQMIKGFCPEVVLGKIYSNWQIVDDIPDGAKLLGYGLDFGYFPDPDAIVAVYYYDNRYYLDEKVYQQNNSPETLVLLCKNLESAPIIADINEPRMIEVLKQNKISIIETEKGAGSVEFGIKHVQGLSVCITRRSTNLIEEYNNYAWLIDKKTGENKKIPDPKCAQHLLDGARYFFTRMIPIKVRINEAGREELRLRRELKQAGIKIPLRRHAFQPSK